MPRGLELPEKQITAAKFPYYSAREDFVRQAITLNYSDTEICNALEVSGQKLQKIKAKIIENESTTLKRISPMEHLEIIKESRAISKK